MCRCTCVCRSIVKVGIATRARHIYDIARTCIVIFKTGYSLKVRLFFTFNGAAIGAGDRPQSDSCPHCPLFWNATLTLVFVERYDINQVISKYNQWLFYTNFNNIGLYTCTTLKNGRLPFSHACESKVCITASLQVSYRSTHKYIFNAF